MQRDYYAFRQVELSDSLSRLEGAAIALDDTKGIQNEEARKAARRTAKEEMKQAAQRTAAIEAHLAYLWFCTRKEEAEKDAIQATNNTDKEYAEKEAKRASEIANSIRDVWQNERMRAGLIPDAFRFIPEVSAITHMPPLSFMLRIPFQLQKPYISRDERDFYLLDNPLRREKVFQVPVVAATSWKGALRAALWQLGYPETNEVIIRLLGNPHGSEEGQAGRLYFYSTFFKEIAFEVINPHSRETGVGKRGPILMECVPKGSGMLVLLYVPLGLIEQEEGKRRIEIAQDLEVLAQGVQAVLTTYGFGAKTSSGFGTAKDQLSSKGTLAFRGDLPGIAAPAAATPELEQPASNLAGYLESLTRLHEDFRQPDGSPKSETDYKALLVSRGQQYTKKRRRDYERAVKWWEREGRQLAEAAAQEFDSLSELRVLSERVAARLRDGNEA